MATATIEWHSYLSEKPERSGTYLVELRDGSKEIALYFDVVDKWIGDDGVKGSTRWTRSIETAYWCSTPYHERINAKSHT